MLIGNDCYFDLLESQKQDMGDGLFPFNSQLSWILGGHTESTAAEYSAELHLLVGTIGTAIVNDKSNVHCLNNTDILSA